MIKSIQHGHVCAMVSHPSAALSPSVSLVIHDQERQDGEKDYAIWAFLLSRQDTSMVGGYSSCKDTRSPSAAPLSLLPSQSSVSLYQ